MSPEERRIIAYLAVAHGLVHVMELTYPALLSRIEADFGIRAVVTGAIATIFGWAFGSTAIPAGFLADRLGSRRVAVYAFCGAAIFSLLVGLAPDEWFLAVALLGLGLSIGLYHPAGLSLAAQAVRNRGMALGLHGVAGNTGQAIAPALAVGLAVLVDWRLAFFTLAALAAVLALALATTRLHLRAGSEIAEGPPLAEGVPAPEASHRQRLLGPLLVVYASFVLGGTVYRGAATYLPAHLEGFVDKDFGGAFVSAAFLMGAVGQFVGGALSQRFALERLVPVIGLATLPALVAVGVVTGPALVVAASAFVFLYFAGQPVFTGLIADYSPPGAVGRSYGISFFAGFGVGGTGGVIAGAFVDRWDTQAAFLGLTGFLAVSVALSFLLWLMYEQRTRGGARQRLVEAA
jgi:predicted MFS family arabinose efflux permease